MTMNKPSIIVTGINGFVGKHLARHLHSHGVSVIGVGQDTQVSADIKDVVDQYYQANLVESWPPTDSVDAIIHLAGLAAVGPSFDDPQRYLNANSAMLTNMAEYYLAHNKKPRIVVVSSGAVYASQQPMPINEDGELSFASPYAVSKLLNEMQVKYYRQRGLDCVVARPFNHIGPGQSEGFILPDLYQRIVELPQNVHTIKVGNISTARDYTDVRDIVAAYEMLALAPSLQSITYNICSGTSLTGTELFTQLSTQLNRSEVTYEIDQSLVRPTDAPRITGDASRIEQELGWKPTYDISRTIADFIRER